MAAKKKAQNEAPVIKLVFNPPKPTDRGYLRRQRKALDLAARLFDVEGSEGGSLVDEIIDLLLPYVEEPENEADAREALEWATEDEIMGLLNAIGGSRENRPNRRK